MGQRKSSPARRAGTLLTRLVIGIFNLLFLATVPGWAVTFTTDTTISDGDTTYDGQDIVVSGCTVTINGAHTFVSLLVTNNGIVTHTANTTTKQYWLDLTITGDVTVDSGGLITADAKGYAEAQGSGSGGGGSNSGGGGGYGGNGGEGHDPYYGAPGGGTYGSVIAPLDLGSGGRYVAGQNGTGGAGGGVLRLTVSGTLTMNGSVTANGGNGSVWTVSAAYGGGGGAGGSVYLTAGTLTGTGSVTANGGNGPGTTYQGGGGGGGRIAIYAGNITGTIVQNITADGGTGYKKGEKGTIYPFAAPPENNPSVEGGEDVFTHSGEYSTSQTDVSIPARGMPIVIERTYRSHSGPINTHFGYGWDFNLAMRLSLMPNGSAWLRTGDNRSVLYTWTGTSFTTPQGRYDTLVKNPGNTFTLTDKHKTRHEFDTNGDLTAIVDRNGNTVSFTCSGPGAGPATMTDATGREITFTYSGDGLLTSITDWAGRTWTYTYDPATKDLLTATAPPTPEFPGGTTTTYAYTNHRLTSITDPRGNTYLSNTYDSVGRISAQTLGGATYTFTYDAANMQTTVTDGRGVQKKTTHTSAGNPSRDEVFTNGIRPGDPASFVTTSEYDASMEETKTTHPRGNRQEFVYDAMGNLLTHTRIAAPVSGEPSIVTGYTYDATYNFIQTITDPRNYITTYTYDPANGNLLQIKQPSVAGGQPTTTFTYNAYGQVVTKTDPDGKVTMNEYDPATGYLIRVTYNYGGTPAQVTEYTYEAAGNRTSVKDPNGNITTYSYNAQNQLTQEVSALGYVTEYSYDANGNRIKVERQNPAAADGWQTATYTYTIRNKVETETDDMDHVTTYTYDANDNQTAVEDAEHHTTQSVYDERNKLYQTIDALNQVTERAYDANGNPASLEDANGNVTAFAYDGFDRWTRTTYPDGGTELRALDAASNLTQVTNRRGQVISWTYDALNRRIIKSRPDYSTINYTYDLIGRLLTTSDATGTITNQYDNLGRLKQVTDTFSNTVAYEYDLAGNRTKLTYPDGSYLTYEYDAMNRLTAIRDPAVIAPADLDADHDVDHDDHLIFEECASGPAIPHDGTPTCQKCDFDPDGDVDQDDFGLFQRAFSGPGPFISAVVAYTYDALSRRTAASLGNGVTVAYTYDDDDRMTGLVHQVRPSALSFAYTHDAVGNRLTRMLNGAVTAYTYDAIYQLTDADYPALQDTTFGYDPVGNRTSVIGGSTTDYVVNNLNEYTTVGGTSYTYDNSGNLTSNGVSMYAYDSENRLVSATTPANSATYVYDAREQRLSKTVNGTATTRFVYDGQQIVAEYNGSGQILRRYIYGTGIDEPVRTDVATTPGGPSFTLYYYHFDALGSVIALTDASGAIAEQYVYDVYGNPQGSSAAGNPYMFTGREYETETGLYHYRARAYDPAIGRFLQTDPMGYHDDENLYTYVKNNPVNTTDPSGLGRNVWEVWRARFRKGAGGRIKQGSVAAAIDKLLADMARRSSGGVTVVGGGKTPINITLPGPRRGSGGDIVSVIGPGGTFVPVSGGGAGMPGMIPETKPDPWFMTFPGGGAPAVEPRSGSGGLYYLKRMPAYVRPPPGMFYL